MKFALLNIKQLTIIHLIQLFALLLIPAMLTGPFLPDLLLSLSVVLFVIYSIKNSYFSIWLNRYLLIAIGVCFYFLFSSLLSNYPLHSMESSLFYFRFVVFSLIIYFLIINKKNFIVYFAYVFLITFTLVSFDAIFQYLFKLNFLMNAPNPFRLSGVFGDEHILGSFISRLMPFCFAMAILISKDSKYIYHFFLFLLILMDILIFLSGGRTAIFYLGLFSILILILTKKYRLARLITLLISLTIILSILSSDNYVKERVINQTMSQMNINNEQERIRVFSLKHEQHFKTGILMFLDKPILGHGPKSFRLECSNIKYNFQNSCSTHPHNTYIQMLSEAGLIGFMIVFVAFSIVVFHLFKHFYYILIYKKYLFSDYEICLLICMLISLWPLVPTPNFFNNWINIVYFLPVGFFMASISKR